MRAKKGAEETEAPKRDATGERMLEVTAFDERGEWEGGCVIPRAWLAPTAEAEEWFRDRWRETT